MTNDVIMMSLPKTMAKFGPPNRFYIIRKVLTRAIQKCTYYLIWAAMSKLWFFLSNFGLFYDARSLNMVMSRDQRSKFRKFFVLT